MLTIRYLGNHCSIRSENANFNWWGCNGDPQTATTLCDRAQGSAAGSLTTSNYTALTLTLSSATPTANTTFTATGSLGLAADGTTKYSVAQDFAYLATPATMNITNVSTQTTSAGTFTSTANTNVSNATITDSGTINSAGNGLASVTVDGCTIKDAGAHPACNSATTYNYTVVAADLSVTGSHSGNFKAGDTADTYTLTVANVGTAPSSGTVYLYDTLPTGFTAVSASGTGWSCVVSASARRSSQTAGKSDATQQMQ